MRISCDVFFRDPILVWLLHGDMAIGFGCFSLFGDLEKVGREGVEMEMPNMRKNSQMRNLRELQQYYFFHRCSFATLMKFVGSKGGD